MEIQIFRRVLDGKKNKLIFSQLNPAVVARRSIYLKYTHRPFYLVHFVTTGLDPFLPSEQP